MTSYRYVCMQPERGGSFYHTDLYVVQCQACVVGALRQSRAQRFHKACYEIDAGVVLVPKKCIIISVHKEFYIILYGFNFNFCGYISLQLSSKGSLAVTRRCLNIVSILNHFFCK